MVIFSFLFISILQEEPEPAVLFESEKYGLRCPVPEDWEIVARERDDLIFVARVPQADPDHPAGVGCELGLAPESLEEYRDRIRANAERGRLAGGLLRNEVVQTADAPWLWTVTEIEPPFGGRWREITVRRIAHRQLYVFRMNINAEDPGFDAAFERFEHLVNNARFDPPDTGAERVETEDGSNRWRQREFLFALDLPEDWKPALAPSQLALLFANGPAHGVWSDNLLVIARPHQPFDAEQLADELPALLQNEDPGSELLRCEVVEQPNYGEAVETVARTERGPFSMTVIERRFRGDRFDYEIKFTLETKRFDALEPTLKECLDSFEELPGDLPAAASGRPG